MRACLQHINAGMHAHAQTAFHAQIRACNKTSPACHPHLQQPGALVQGGGALCGALGQRRACHGIQQWRQQAVVSPQQVQGGDACRDRRGDIKLGARCAARSHTAAVATPCRARPAGMPGCRPRQGSKINPHQFLRRRQPVQQPATRKPPCHTLITHRFRGRPPARTAAPGTAQTGRACGQPGWAPAQQGWSDEPGRMMNHCKTSKQRASQAPGSAAYAESGVLPT